MAGDRAQIAIAANRDVSSGVPRPEQDCSDVIHISIFFDGTGNNLEVDTAASKWSNVARLYQSAKFAAQDNPRRTYFPIYVSGVGTPYNGGAANWLSLAASWVEDGLPGAGAGAGGDRRMNHGGDMVNDRLRDVLIANAKAHGGALGKYAAENSKKGFSEVNAAVAKHRLIKVINLSIFGFSRGAALARAFSNRIVAACTTQEEQLLYHNYPLRLNFMGVFDTVASFGVPALNARSPFTERELLVPAAVERCVHFVAAHEVRFSFPVDLIRKNGKLPDQWVERVFPGVHSDVGGGYEPNDQQIDNNYARIPMREMMKAALSSGVRMLSYDYIRDTQAPVFAERFECRAETLEAYRLYMAARGAKGGTIEEQIRQHLGLYYCAHGTMHRSGIKSVGDRSRDTSKYKKLLGSQSMAQEVLSYRSLLKAGMWLRLSDSTGRGFAQYVKIEDWQLTAWDETAPGFVVDFVSRYVHDSKVDFIGNIEPFSYFRPRGVEESTISVWQEGGNWLTRKVRTAIETTSQTLDAVARTPNYVEPSFDAAAVKIYEDGARWVRQRVRGVKNFDE